MFDRVSSRQGAGIFEFRKSAEDKPVIFKVANPYLLATEVERERCFFSIWEREKSFLKENAVVEVTGVSKSAAGVYSYTFRASDSEGSKSQTKDEIPHTVCSVFKSHQKALKQNMIQVATAAGVSLLAPGASPDSVEAEKNRANCRIWEKAGKKFERFHAEDSNQPIHVEITDVNDEGYTFYSRGFLKDFRAIKDKKNYYFEAAQGVHFNSEEERELVEYSIWRACGDLKKNCHIVITGKNEGQITFYDKTDLDNNPRHPKVALYDMTGGIGDHEAIFAKHSLLEHTKGDDDKDLILIQYNQIGNELTYCPIEKEAYKLDFNSHPHEYARTCIWKYLDDHKLPKVGKIHLPNPNGFQFFIQETDYTTKAHERNIEFSTDRTLRLSNDYQESIYSSILRQLPEGAQSLSICVKQQNADGSYQYTSQPKKKEQVKVEGTEPPHDAAKKGVTFTGYYGVRNQQLQNAVWAKFKDEIPPGATIHIEYHVYDSKSNVILDQYEVEILLPPQLGTVAPYNAPKIAVKAPFTMQMQTAAFVKPTMKTDGKGFTPEEYKVTRVALEQIKNTSFDWSVFNVLYAILEFLFSPFVMAYSALFCSKEHEKAAALFTGDHKLGGVTNHKTLLNQLEMINDLFEEEAGQTPVTDLLKDAIQNGRLLHDAFHIDKTVYADEEARNWNNQEYAFLDRLSHLGTSLWNRLACKDKTAFKEFVVDALNKKIPTEEGESFLLPVGIGEKENYAPHFLLFYKANNRLMLKHIHYSPPHLQKKFSAVTTHDLGSVDTRQFLADLIALQPHDDQTLEHSERATSRLDNTLAMFIAKKINERNQKIEVDGLDETLKGKVATHEDKQKGSLDPFKLIRNAVIEANLHSEDEEVEERLQDLLRTKATFMRHYVNHLVKFLEKNESGFTTSEKIKVLESIKYYGKQLKHHLAKDFNKGDGIHGAILANDITDDLLESVSLRLDEQMRVLEMERNDLKNLDGQVSLFSLGLESSIEDTLKAETPEAIVRSLKKEKALSLDPKIMLEIDDMAVCIRNSDVADKKVRNDLLLKLDGQTKAISKLLEIGKVKLAKMQAFALLKALPPPAYENGATAFWDRLNTKQEVENWSSCIYELSERFFEASLRAGETPLAQDDAIIFNMVTKLTLFRLSERYATFFPDEFAASIEPFSHLHPAIDQMFNVKEVHIELYEIPIYKGNEAASLDNEAFKDRIRDVLNTEIQNRVLGAHFVAYFSRIRTILIEFCKGNANGLNVADRKVLDGIDKIVNDVLKEKFSEVSHSFINDLMGNARFVNVGPIWNQLRLKLNGPQTKEALDAEFANVLKSFKEEVLKGVAADKKAAFEDKLSRLPALYAVKSRLVAQRKDQVRRGALERLTEKWQKEDEQEQIDISIRNKEIKRFDEAVKKHNEGRTGLQHYLEGMQAWSEGRGSKPSWRSTGLNKKSHFPTQLEEHYQAKKDLPGKIAAKATKVQNFREKVEAYNRLVLEQYQREHDKDATYRIESNLPSWDGPGNYPTKIVTKFSDVRYQSNVWRVAPKSNEEILNELLNVEVNRFGRTLQDEIDQLEDQAANVPACQDVPAMPAGARPEPKIARKVREPEVLKAEREVELANAIIEGMHADVFLANVNALTFGNLGEINFWFNSAYALEPQIQAFCGHLAREMGISKESYAETLYARKGNLKNFIDIPTGNDPHKYLLMKFDNSLTNFGTRPEMAQLRKDCAHYVKYINNLAKIDLAMEPRIHFLIGYNDRREHGDGLMHFPHPGGLKKDVNGIFNRQVQMAAWGYGLPDENDGLDLLAAHHVSRITKFQEMSATLENPQQHLEKYRWTNVTAALNVFSSEDNDGLRESLRSQDRVFMVAAEQGKDYTGNRISQEKRSFVLSSRSDEASGSYCTHPSDLACEEARTAFRKAFIGSPSVSLINDHGIDDGERQKLWEINLLSRPTRDWYDQEKRAQLAKDGNEGLMTQKKTIKEFLLRTSAIVSGKAKDASEHPFSWYSVIFTLNCIKECADELVDMNWGRQVRDKLLSNVFQAGLIEEALMNNPHFFLTAIPHLNQMIAYYKKEKGKDKDSGNPQRFDAAALCIHNICDKIRKAAITLNQLPNKPLTDALFKQINELLPDKTPDKYKERIEGFIANGGPYQRLFALAHLEYFRDNHKGLFESFNPDKDWLSILRSQAMVMQLDSDEGHTGVEEEVRHYFGIKLLPSIEEFLRRDVTNQTARNQRLNLISGLAPNQKWVQANGKYQYKTTKSDGSTQTLDLTKVDQTPDIKALRKEIDDFEAERNQFLTDLAGLTLKVKNPKWTFDESKPYEYRLVNDQSVYILNICTGEGVEIKTDSENRSGLPQHVLDHPDFKFLFGDKKESQEWRSPITRGDIVEFRRRDRSEEIDYLIRVNKTAKTFQIFQEHRKKHAREDEKPILFRFTRLKIDESTLGISFNSNNTKVEKLIAEKGAWVRLNSKDQPEMDKVFVAQMGHRIDKDQIRLHISKNPITRNSKIARASVGEGASRKWIVSSMARGEAELLPFKNLENLLLLSSDGKHVDEIRFFKPEGEKADDTNGYYLALRRNESNHHQWDVVNRKGWKWQLQNTAHLDKQFGENWRENSLHLINEETGEEEHWFFPYIAVSNEKSGASVTYMKKMVQFVDLLKEMFDSGMTTIGSTNEMLNEKSKQFFTYFFKDIFQDNSHKLAPDTARWDEIVLKELFNEFMEAPFDILRAAIGSASEAYSEKRERILKKSLLKFHEAQMRVLNAAGQGNLEAQAMEMAREEFSRLVDDKMKKFQGDLNKFFKGILSPQPLKIGSSGQSGSHAAFLYQAHLASLRGDYAVAADYLDRMVKKGVSNTEEDVEQLEFLITKVILRDSLTQIVQGQLAHPVGLRQTAFQLKLILNLKEITPRLEVQHKKKVGSLLGKLLSNYDSSAFQLGVNVGKMAGETQEMIILSALSSEYHSKLAAKKGELQSLGLLLTKKEDEILRKHVPINLLSLFDPNSKDNIVSLLPPAAGNAIKTVMGHVSATDKPTVVNNIEFVVPTEKEVSTLMRTITQNMNGDQNVDIRELHKKKGSYPKWETLISNFYSYIHWIYYTDKIAPADLSFLMAEIPLLTRHRAEIITARNLLLLFYHHRKSGYFNTIDEDSGLHLIRDDFTDALKKIQRLATEFASDEVEENIRAYRRHAADHPSSYDLAQWGMYRVWGSTSKWLNQGGDKLKVGPEDQRDHGRFHELHGACWKVLHTHLLSHFKEEDRELSLRGFVEEPEVDDLAPPIPVDPAPAPVEPPLTQEQIDQLPPKENIWHTSSGRLKRPFKIIISGFLNAIPGIDAVKKEQISEKIISLLKPHVLALIDHDDFYSGYKEFTEVFACFADWALALFNQSNSSVSGVIRASADPNFLPSNYFGSSAEVTLLIQQMNGIKKSLEEIHADFQKKQPKKGYAPEPKREVVIDVKKQNPINWDEVFGRTDVVENGELNPIWNKKLATEIAIIEEGLSKLPDSTKMEEHYLKKLIEGAKKSSAEEKRYKCTRSLTVTQLTPLTEKLSDRLKVLSKEIADYQDEIDMLVRANSESLEMASLIACADELGRTQEGNRLGRRIFNLVLDKYREGKIKSLELETKLTNFLLACTERDQLKKAQEVVRSMHARVDQKTKGLRYSIDEVDLAKAVQEMCDGDILWLLMSHDLHQFLSEGSDRKRYAKESGDPGRFVLDQPSIYRKYLVLDFERKQIARLKARESIEKIVNGQYRPIIVATPAQIASIKGVFAARVLGIDENTPVYTIRNKKEAFVTRAEFNELSLVQDAIFRRDSKDERIFEITKLKRRLHVIEEVPVILSAGDDVATTIANLKRDQKLLLVTSDELNRIKGSIKDLNQVVEFNHAMSLAGIHQATTKKVHFDKVRMGVGKSTNIFPLATKIFIEKGYEPVVVTTEELLTQLRDFMDEKAFIFDFNINYGLTQEDSKDDAKVIAHLTKLRDTFLSLKSEGRYPLTTPARLGFVRNKRGELSNQLLSAQPNTPEQQKCFEKLQLMKEISGYFWREEAARQVPRPGVVFLEDEDVCRAISKEYNYAIGDKGPVDRQFYNMFEHFVLKMMDYKDANGKYKFRHLLMTNALRSLPDITDELIPVLESLYEDTEFWQNKTVGWSDWKKVDKKQFIDYVTGKTNQLPKGVAENAKTEPALLNNIYTNISFWKRVGLPRGALSLTFDQFTRYLDTRELPPSLQNRDEKTILEKFFICFDYWKKVGGTLNPEEIEAYILGKRKDPPQNMHHTKYLAALRALLTKNNGTMGAVYHINADMSRGFHPGNKCEVMPYSDGVPKPNHMFGVVKEYILHHLFQYASAIDDKGLDEDLFWNTRKALMKDNLDESISPLDPSDTWSCWNDRLAKKSMELSGSDKGNLYKAFIHPDCFRERLQFLRHLMFANSSFMKIYHQQVICNSQDVTLGKKPIMASGTGDPWSLNLDDDDHDASNEPDMISGETLLALFSLKDGYQGADAPEGLNKPIMKPFDDVKKQFAELAANPDCRAIINSGFEVCQNQYQILVAQLRQIESCKHRQFLYVDSVTKKRMIWNPGESAQPIDYHPDQVNKKLAIALYGPAQKRGIEFALPKGERDFGVFMADLSSTIEEMAQGFYRMRQFGYGQQGQFLPDVKMAEFVSKITGKKIEDLTQGDVIRAICRKTVETEKLTHVKSLVFKFKEYLKQEVEKISRMAFDLTGVQDYQSFILFEKIFFKIHRELYIQIESIDWMKMFGDQTEVDRFEYIEKTLQLEIKRVQKMREQFIKDMEALKKEMSVKSALSAGGGLMGAIAGLLGARPAAGAPAANPAPKRAQDQILGRYNQLLEGYKRAENSLQAELDKLRNNPKTREYYSNNLPEKIPADLDGHCANMDMVVEMQVEMQVETQVEKETETEQEITVAQPYFGYSEPLNFDEFVNARGGDEYTPESDSTFYSLWASRKKLGGWGSAESPLTYPSMALNQKLAKHFPNLHPYISIRAQRFLMTKGAKGDASLFVLVMGQGSGSKSCIITQSDLTHTVGPALQRLRGSDNPLPVAVLPLTPTAELSFNKEDLPPMYLDFGCVDARDKLAKNYPLTQMMLFNKFVLDWTNYTQEERACYEAILKDKSYVEELIKYLNEIHSVRTKNMIERDLKRLKELGPTIKSTFGGLPDELISKFILDCTYYNDREQDAFDRIIANAGFAAALLDQLKTLKAYHTIHKIKKELEKLRQNKDSQLNNRNLEDVSVDISLSLRPPPSRPELVFDKHNGDYQTQKEDDKANPPDLGDLGMPLPTPSPTAVPGAPAAASRTLAVPSAAAAAARSMQSINGIELDEARGFVTLVTSQGRHSMLKIVSYDRAGGILTIDGGQKYQLDITQSSVLPADLKPYMVK